MSLDIDFIIKNYKEKLEQIYKETKDPEEIKKQLKVLEERLCISIERTSEKLEDSEKIELSKLLKDEDNIARIVLTLNDKETISQFLQENEQVKEKLVESLFRKSMSSSDESEKSETIKLINNTGLGKEILEHVKKEALENGSFSSLDRFIENVSETIEEKDKIKIIELLKENGKPINRVVLRLENDENKLKYLEECRVGKENILLTIKDKKIISQFLQDNEKMKEDLMFSLVSKMNHYIEEEHWQFMKLAELEEEVIPCLLASSNYRILEDLNEEMKADVEEYLGKSIPENIKDEDKIELIERLKDTTIGHKHISKVVLTIEDKEKLSQFLQKNEEIKKEMVELLYEEMRNKPKEEMWQFMKKAGVENQVIPHLLADSKYEILEKMNEEMKADVEKYLGKSIPENIKEMSEYEKIGIDLDAIQEDVITNREQLNIDDMQQKFLSSCRADRENKKSIPLKDFVGTVALNLKQGLEKSDIKTWEDLLKGLKRMDVNIEKHSERYLFRGDRGDEPIRLQGINGKYFVRINGNHRMTMLKLRYLTEIKRANGDQKRIEEIDKEYSIKVASAVDVPKDKEEMLGINMLADINEIQQNETIISECIEKGEKIGYKIQEPEKEEIIITTKEELKEYLGEKIQEIESDELQKQKWNKQLDTYKSYPEYLEAFKAMSGYTIEENQTEVEIEQIQEQEEIVKEETKNVIEESLPPHLEEITEEREAEKSSNIWMERFKQWDSETRNVPQQLKNKYTRIKSEIVKFIKEARRTIEQNKENKGKNEGVYR